AFDLVLLFVLCLLTAGLLLWLYNDLVFASFSPSLARSRNIRVRLCSYLFIVLLGLLVNVCLRATGALLINAMLIVPAAAAAIFCRNMRQLFWVTIGLCLLVGFVGQWVSWRPVTEWEGERIYLGSGGMMVVLSVLLFFGAMAGRLLWRGVGLLRGRAA